MILATTKIKLKHSNQKKMLLIAMCLIKIETRSIKLQILIYKNMQLKKKNLLKYKNNNNRM